MLLKDRIFEEARRIIKSHYADSVEVVVHRKRSNVIRYASSVFHQGVAESDCEIYIRVLLGKKVGVASGNSLEKSALKECLRRAVSIAEHVKEEPFKFSLPLPANYSAIISYFESTAYMPDSEKVASLSKGFIEAKKSGVLQSGSFTTKTGEIAVLNSKGVEAYHPYTFTFLTAVSTKGEGSGFKSALSKDITRIDVQGVLSDSAGRCLMAVPSGEIEPGVYRALLEPPAVCELLHWLSYIGFGAKGFHEGTSFLSGRLNEKITGENVTIYDDALDEEGMSAPFDMEGVPKRRLSIIEKGIAKGVAYDSFTAAIEDGETTGHAPFPGDTEGPLPSHIFMEAGNLSPEDMLEMLGKGVLVKSFHYVNGLLNPKETVMTGMTRHGTFYVDGGKIKYPVRSLRFTENIMKALSRAIGISKETELFPNHAFPLSSVSAPYILIDGFSFTS